MARIVDEGGSDELSLRNIKMFEGCVSPDLAVVVIFGESLPPPIANYRYSYKYFGDINLGKSHGDR